jgi:hypothetical protein
MYVHVVWWIFNGLFLITSYAFAQVSPKLYEPSPCIQQIDLTPQPHLTDMGLAVGVYTLVIGLFMLGFVRY